MCEGRKWWFEEAIKATILSHHFFPPETSSLFQLRHFVLIFKAKGRRHITKIDFFRASPKLPLPPTPLNLGKLYNFFLDVKNDVFARITEPSNNDYDINVSDNCDN